MKPFPLIMILALCLVMPSELLAQVEEHEHEEHKHVEQEQHEGHERKKHALSFIISHTHLSTGFDESGSKWLSLPSFGLNYDFKFADRWAIGLHTEMIVEEFVVKGDPIEKTVETEPEFEGIERGRPIAITVIGTYKIHDHVSFLAGGGREFSEHEDFWMIRFGLEFPFHLGKNWEVFGTLEYDFKLDAYDSFTFGLGIARLF